jgi:hypothetical protein
MYIFYLYRDKHTDEMCAFYLQYYTDYPGNIHDVYCYPSYTYSLRKNIRSRIFLNLRIFFLKN